MISTVYRRIRYFQPLQLCIIQGVINNKRIKAIIIISLRSFDNCPNNNNSYSMISVV